MYGTGTCMILAHVNVRAHVKVLVHLMELVHVEVLAHAAVLALVEVLTHVGVLAHVLAAMAHIAAVPARHMLTQYSNVFKKDLNTYLYEQTVCLTSCPFLQPRIALLHTGYHKLNLINIK